MNWDWKGRLRDWCDSIRELFSSSKLIEFSFCWMLLFWIDLGSGLLLFSFEGLFLLLLLLSLFAFIFNLTEFLSAIYEFSVLSSVFDKISEFSSTFDKLSELSFV